MAKGSGFEREIAKSLSLWWTDGKREDVFYRSHASGARFTQRKKAGKDTAYQSGDITCSDPIGKALLDFLSIECKTGYGSKIKSGTARWDVLDLIDSKQKEPVLLKMWHQCESDAEKSNKEPLLIFRRNQRTPCVVMRTKLLNSLIEYFNTPMSTIKAGRLTIMGLEEFFEWIPNIRAVLKKGE